MAGPGIDAEVSFSAALCASLDRNTAMLRAAEVRKQQMAADVSYIPNPLPRQFAGSALPTLLNGFGPQAGWNWAVQRIVAAGLGTSDYLTVYRGASKDAVQDENALFTFTITVAGAVATWHPGRTGLVLLGRDQSSLAFGGSSSSTALTVSADVIQVTDAQLPYFLL